MQRRKNEDRRRTGCWTCKKKHVKCSEERPSCSRCQRLRVDCEYEFRLLWKEDAIQRNISLGREGKWSKLKKPAVKSEPGPLYQPINLRRYIGGWIFLNVTTNDFQNSPFVNHDFEDLPPMDGDEEEVETPDSGTVITASHIGPYLDRGRDLLSLYPSQSFNFFLGCSTVEESLFSYFVTSICPSCSLSPSQNPYLTYLTPMSFSFPALRHSLLAVSANQLRLLNDRRFEKESWIYKSKAIQGVQNAINAGNLGVGIVATVLMLCFYDISDGCNRAWVTHLRGGLSLLDQVSKSTQQGGKDNFRSFLRMYFIAHDIMSRTACDEDIVDQSFEWVADDSIDEIDVLMGCSRGLMNLIRRISVLASQAKELFERRSYNSSERLALSRDRDSIKDSLQNLVQILPPLTHTSSDLPLIAEAKRLTALLYLDERLCSLPMSKPFALPPSGLIAKIISLIKALPDSPTLLWPLFILGNAGSSLDEGQRRFVHERLTALQKVRNLGSVRRAKKVVEEKWRRVDLDISREGENPRMRGETYGKHKARLLISLA